MEPEGSLPHSQASANCPCPGPAQTSITSEILRPALDHDLENVHMQYVALLLDLHL